ncbi:hypothetical protein [Bacillus sp. 2205SS5-2]|uniref:hypothetical protein n=1 Tax=Bacillus sp. 2205SS5-2 TaxID=3109031 RepID=UPI003004D4C9
MRLVVYGVMMLGIFPFLPWVPKKRNFLSDYGQKTAFIYILHLPIIKVLHSVGWFESFYMWKIVISPVLALGFSLLLCSKPVLIIMNPFIAGDIVNKVRDTILVLQGLKLRKGCFRKVCGFSNQFILYDIALFRASILKRKI